MTTVGDEASATGESEADAPPWWRTNLPGLTLAFTIVIWALGPPVSKLITAPPLVTASVRFWVSVPILFAITAATGHRVTRETLRHTGVAGALFGLNMVFVFAALQHASVAVLAVLQALLPGLVLVAAGPWLGEKATRWHVVWTVAGIGGVIVVVLGNGPEVTIEPIGVLYGVLSLVSFAGYYLLTRKVRTTYDVHPLEWMSGSTLFSAITVTPIALVFSSADDYRELAGIDLLYLAFVTGAVGILGHTLMSWVHKFISASRSSLYMLGMTVLAVLVAWPINGEPFTLQQVLGGAIVIGAVAAVVSRPAEQL